MTRTLIANGTLVDGTGAARRKADLLLERGRVVEIGEGLSADDTVDATGMIVSPGFIDIHTHYDAQALWDPAMSPSPSHGVTTVIAGNCGFSLAPSSERNVDYLQRMMANVEGIPLEAIRAGIKWEWRSLPEYLERLEGAVGPNVGFLAGHSALRRDVMGERAAHGVADEDDLRMMERALAESLDAGALGFSSSLAVTHKDGDGMPVPSRVASEAELVRLSRIVRSSAGVSVQLTSPGAVDGFSSDEIDLMIAMSHAADRALNWNQLTVRAGNQEFTDRQMSVSRLADEQGARVIALMLPHSQRLRFTLKSGLILNNLPGWEKVLGLPHSERIAALHDAETRRQLREGASSGKGYVGAIGRSIRRMELADCRASWAQPLIGRSIGEIAQELDTTPVDALIDLALSDDLEAGFRSPASEHEDELWAERARVWGDSHVLLGASDAGAHLDMMCGTVYTTTLLSEGVRERKLISLERAVALLAREPAELYGLRDRGVLRPGAIADIVIFDPDRVRPGPERLQYDLPGGCARVVASAEGIPHVMVGGVPIVRDGKPTSVLPGTVLRAGRDAA